MTQTEQHGLKDWLRAALDYADELLSYRAEVTAEVESKLAAEEGQRIAWGRMVEDGVIPPTTRKMWVAQSDSDVDAACVELDGETAPLDGFFTTDQGEVIGPPLHPFCRCTLVLVEGEDD